MAVAVVGAGEYVAVEAGESGVADANAVVAVLVIAASVNATSQTAVDAHPSTVTHASPVHTASMAAASVRALQLSAVLATIPSSTVAHTVTTDAVDTRWAGLRSTVLASEGLVANASEVEACSMT